MFTREKSPVAVSAWNAVTHTNLGFSNLQPFCTTDFGQSLGRHGAFVQINIGFNFKGTNVNFSLHQLDVVTLYRDDLRFDTCRDEN